MIIQSIINMSVDLITDMFFGLPPHILILRIIIWWFMIGVLPWQFIHLRSWSKTHRNDMYKRDILYVFILTGPIMLIPSIILYRWSKSRKKEWTNEYFKYCSENKLIIISYNDWIKNVKIKKIKKTKSKKTKA